MKVSLPDRKYPTEFINSCIKMFESRKNPLLMFTCNAVQEMSKSFELTNLKEFKEK